MRLALLICLVSLFVACSSSPRTTPPSSAPQPNATVDQSATQDATAAKIFATLTASAPVATTPPEPSPTSTDEALAALPTAPKLNQVIGTVSAVVNIRAKPDASAAKLGQLKPGDQIVIIGKTPSEDWYQFEKGWVIATAIETLGNLDALQVVNVEPSITSAPNPTDPPVAVVTRVLPTKIAQPTVQTSGRFVASSIAKKYYYCETDPAWKELSQANLVWSDDESVFTKRGLVLHQAC